MSVDFPQPEGALITIKSGFVSMARIVYHTRPRYATEVSAAWEDAIRSSFTGGL